MESHLIIQPKMMTGEDEREREQEVFDKGENFYEVTWVDEGMRLHAMAITATPTL